MSKEVKKEEVKVESKVSVEMTPEQKDKVVAFLAGLEPVVPVEKPKVDVTLRFSHYRNGLRYGPGRCILDSDLGNSLYVADQTAYMSELSQADSRIVKIAMMQNGITTITEDKPVHGNSGIKKL